MYLLELARATSFVSFGSIQTLLFPHFNTVAASLFWSLKNAINLYSFNYNNDVVTTVLNPTDYQLPTGAIDVPLDGSEQMQCTTCHDPHEDTRGDATYGLLPFWRHQGNAASYDAVCNDCHRTPPNSGSPLHTLP